ncbi:uncharacterized protein LOC130356606 [Hyla sarda]|uniref:uncharacterized protein LOC130356606 n=1 Tax=Hyla sarda TaxID=327740 RepID=UPI0024C26043|nr:uncharacterized protein LOC130356606 [Hyla sarda]
MGLVGRSVTRSTWESYSRWWADWELLLRQLSITGAPSEWEAALLFYVGRAFCERVSPSGLGRRMAALAFWFKVRGVPDGTKSFLVRQAVRGFRKGASSRDWRKPVTFSLLLRLGSLLAGVCFSVYELCLFRLAFALAFFGAFRISELVSPSRCRAGGLLFSDVVLVEGVLQCRVRRSKTDQLGRGAVVRLARLGSSEMCPVACYSAFLALRVGIVGPLLVHADGGFLSRFQFVGVFRKCLRAGGFVAEDYSSHSFRIGAATEASRWGLGPEMVKQIGRWESERYRLYVRPHLL